MKTRRLFLYPALCMAGVFLLAFFAVLQGPINFAQAGIADYLVINELATADGSTSDDWVELYNPTAGDINLNGWSIQKVTKGGGTPVRTDLTGIIPAGGYFLIVRDDANGDLLAQADMVSSNFALADHNVLYLVHSNSNIDPESPSAVYIDHVGWGAIEYDTVTVWEDNPLTGESLSRDPDGEDTNQITVDFITLSTPTPQNSGLSGSGDLNGTVLVTITPDAQPVQSITAVGASIVFQVNSNGSAMVEYGISESLGSVSAVADVFANTDTVIDLSGLSCDTTYYYQINASNSDDTDSDISPMDSFATLPCGIDINEITMTQTGAKANDSFDSGWQWQFDVTVWNEAETELFMKFGPWSGAGALTAADNMRYSADGGTTWVSISADDAYPALGADVSGLDESTDDGRQLSIIVEMKVPFGTPAGDYGTNYGIMTDLP